jgi:hypothetical protein
VYGFAITTANTIQTENQFLSIQWTDIAFVLRSIEGIFKNYPIKAVKLVFPRTFARNGVSTKGFHTYGSFGFTVLKVSTSTTFSISRIKAF